MRHYRRAVASVREGDQIQAYREPDNPFDPDAILLTNARGEKIGYIPRDSFLKDVVHDEGRGFTALVARKRRRDDGETGVILEVEIVDEELPLVPARLPEPPPRWWEVRRPFRLALYLVLALIVYGAIVGAAPASSGIMAAPRGDPQQIAFREITAASYPCPRVVEATRRADGSIVARCSNRRSYFIFRQRGYRDSVVLGCREALDKLGIGCAGS